jgi:hypothetical protein
MKITLPILILLLPTILYSQGSNQEVIPIGTGKGVLMAYNFPNSHFTIRIEGENVRPAQRPYVFFVDNRALQLVTVDLKDIRDFSNCKNKADSLGAHQKYELSYLEGVLSKQLNLEDQEILARDSKTFMFWHFNLPPEMNSQLERQLQITTIIKDKLLMLKTAGTKNEQISDLKNWLTNFAFTLTVYDKLIDIQKLIEEIKMER